MDRCRVVHAIPMLVDADPQPPANFLTARDRVVAVFEHAHDEDIGVIPAFPQGGVGENEPDRFREGEQPFLVLEDQIVGIHIIGKPGVLSTDLEARIGELLGFLVDGEVTVVGAANLNTLQIFLIHPTIQRKKTQIFSFEPLVFFLKYPGIFSLLIGLAVVPVFDHLVDEEKGQRLDALGKKNLLLLEVSPDRLPDLNPPDGHFRDVAGCIARTQNMTIG